MKTPWGGNRLDNKTAAELAEAFRAIPASVASLDLSVNFLGDKTAAELADIFASIPPHVATINLKGNKLEQVGTVEEVGDLLLATEKNFLLDDGKVFSRNLIAYMNYKNQQIKPKVFPHIGLADIVDIIGEYTLCSEPNRYGVIYQPVSQQSFSVHEEEKKKAPNNAFFDEARTTQSSQPKVTSAQVIEKLQAITGIKGGWKAYKKGAVILLTLDDAALIKKVCKQLSDKQFCTVEEKRNAATKQPVLKLTNINSAKLISLTSSITTTESRGLEEPPLLGAGM